jgi:hypothetical protein
MPRITWASVPTGLEEEEEAGELAFAAGAFAGALGGGACAAATAVKKSNPKPTLRTRMCAPRMLTSREPRHEPREQIDARTGRRSRKAAELYISAESKVKTANTRYGV